MHSELIIIGAGPGGYETAVSAAKQGKHVTIFEAGALGGTCLNVGCIPTKCFCRNAEIIDNLKEASSFGIDELSYTFNFAKVIERKNAVVSQLQTGVATLLNNPLITLVNFKASFKDQNTVTANGEEYTADKIIVATGSEPKFLPIEGAHLPNVLTSDDLLSIDHVPATLCIIGGGVIGLEFASIFNSFGSQVTVVEFCKEILPNFDSDIAKRLKQVLSKKGIKFFTSAAVKKISNGEEDIIVEFEQKGKVQKVACEKALMAVGRKPVLPEGLNEAAVNFNVHGIEVDDKFHTTSPAEIYAIGDANGKCMLAHAATAQGKFVLGEKVNLDVIPAAVFTNPEAAMVGITEDSAKQQGIETIIKKSFFRINGKALAMNEPDGMVKLVISTKDNKILGCHIFGLHAADLIQEISDLMCKGATIDEFATMIHAHPTLGEVLHDAAL